uniref:Uncharacterized protein n=1 Tax=Anguilla anguilla TaxID=7936 RepID=A0A0E9T998_ANGAN
MPTRGLAQPIGLNSSQLPTDFPQSGKLLPPTLTINCPHP